MKPKPTNSGESASVHYTFFNNGEYIVLPYEDILFFESNGNYSSIICRPEKGYGTPYVVCRTLGHITEEVDSGIFYRCHRSYLVNVGGIRKCVKDGRSKGGAIYFDLKATKPMAYFSNRYKKGMIKLGFIR
jgi:DNA-binding LytR/AlgR family response regulator